MKIPCSIFSAMLFLFVATTNLAAQVHLGTKNPYPIGNNDITSKVFLFFLQQKSIQGYEDDAFMTSPNNWLGNSKASIEYTGKAPNFTYSLIAKNEENIIDAVNDADIQKQFNSWYVDLMKNPTRQEVCDYLRCKSLAYFWSHDGQKIGTGEQLTAKPTVYFDDEGHNVTGQHQFLISSGSLNPNHDHPITGADAISKCYEDTANKIAAKYPNSTFWQPTKHESPIFMNGRIRLLQVQPIPSGSIFDFMDFLYDEKISSSIKITRQDVTQQQDLFDFTPFNSSAPVPPEFMATVFYDNAVIGKLQSSTDLTPLNDKFTAITTHDQFTNFFNTNIEPNFINSPIIKFGAEIESFSESAWMGSSSIRIKSFPILVDPTTGWQRDTYDLDLFGVMYDALDIEIN